MKSRAVFFDRDGTLMEEVHYCSDPAQVKMYAGVPEALRKLKEVGFRTLIVSNQSGIGRGLFTLDQYRVVESEVLRQLGDDLVDATYYCPDPPGQKSKSRKPAPGMVVKATDDHHIDLSRSFFIGDKESDVECAHNAGVRAIRVRTRIQRDMTGSNAEWVVDDVPAAVQLILNSKS